VAQDDYYYEIQLTNKQLVFYFMAGASGLILSFLAGIMVGRGVDATPEVQAASGRPAIEDRIITEDPPPSTAASKAAQPEEMTYARDLEREKPISSAPVPAPVAETKKGSVTIPVATLPPASGRRQGPDPLALPPTSGPRPSTATTTASAPPAAEPSSGAFTIQVGAYKEKAYADQQVGNLKKKGYAAYVVSPDGADSLFNVRVGSFGSQAAAEKVKTQLIGGEKLKPFIVKQ